MNSLHRELLSRNTFFIPGFITVILENNHLCARSGRGELGWTVGYTLSCPRVVIHFEFFCPPLLKMSKINSAKFLNHLQKWNCAQRCRRYKKASPQYPESPPLIPNDVFFFLETQYRKTRSHQWFVLCLTVWEYYLYEPISNSLLQINNSCAFLENGIFKATSY